VSFTTYKNGINTGTHLATFDALKYPDAPLWMNNFYNPGGIEVLLGYFRNISNNVGSLFETGSSVTIQVEDFRIHGYRTIHTQDGFGNDMVINVDTTEGLIGEIEATVTW